MKSMLLLSLGAVAAGKTTRRALTRFRLEGGRSAGQYARDPAPCGNLISQGCGLSPVSAPPRSSGIGQSTALPTPVPIILNYLHTLGKRLSFFIIKNLFQKDYPCVFRLISTYKTKLSWQKNCIDSYYKLRCNFQNLHPRDRTSGFCFSVNSFALSDGGSP
jgi:hypothetical protein